MKNIVTLITFLAFVALLLPCAILAEPPTGNNYGNSADNSNPVGGVEPPPLDDPWGVGHKLSPCADDRNGINDPNPDLNGFFIVVKIWCIKIITPGF